LFCGNAPAATETFSLSSPTINNFNGNFAFTGFNASLGTLTGITLDLNISTSADVTVDNSSSSSGSFTSAAVTLKYSLAGPNGSALLTAVPVTLTVAPETVSSGPAVVTYPSNTVNSTEDLTINSGFSSYEVAAPKLTFSAPPGTYKGTTADSHLLFGGNTSSDATGTISYIYNAIVVPEPSSWALALVCVGLFAYLRFRTRRGIR